MMFMSTIVQCGINVIDFLDDNIEMEQKNTLNQGNPLFLLAKAIENKIIETKQAMASLENGCFSTLFLAIDTHNRDKITLKEISQYCAVENITAFGALFQFTEDDHITEAMFIEKMNGRMEGKQYGETMSLTETAYLFVRFIQMLGRNEEKIAAVRQDVKWQQVKQVQDYFYTAYGVEQLTKECLRVYLKDNGIYCEEIVNEIIKQDEVEWKDLFPVHCEKEEKCDDIMMQIQNIQQILKEKKNNLTNRFKEIEESQEGVFIPTTQERKSETQSNRYMKRNSSLNNLKKSSLNIGGRENIVQKKLNEIESNINYVQMLSKREHCEFVKQKYLKKYEQANTLNRTGLSATTMMRLKEIEDSSRQSYLMSTRKYQQRLFDAVQNNYNGYQAAGIRLKTSGPIYGIRAERRVQWYLSARRRFM